MATRKSKSTYSSRRRKRSKLPEALLVVVVLALVALVAWCSEHDDSTETSAAQSGKMPDAEQLMKVEMPDDVPDIFVNYKGFELSFNPMLHVPNYVAWELTGREADGQLERESDFRQDRDILGCASLDDYRRSGFDRGHMAPAADMKWNKSAMSDCHFLTNICPQDHSLNSGPWKTLEDNCRNWARRDSAIIIVCGPVLTDPIARTIGRQQVVVPERFFKVVLAPWANPPRGIGFVMNNSNSNPGGVQTTATTIDEVERITGFDFFAALPDDIEESVESSSKYLTWQKPR